MLLTTFWFRLGGSGAARAGATGAGPDSDWTPGDRERHARLLSRSRERAGDGWRQHDLRGTGWGGVVLHPLPGAWRWPAVAGDGDRTVVSVGVPVGVAPGTSAADLGRAALAGQDVHAGLVPPFGLLVLDEGRGTAVVQQDWLGMSRLYTRSRHGILTVSSRSFLVPVADGGPGEPDVQGWSGYVAAGHFAGGEAPVTAVRLLDGGERIALTRQADGSWVPARESRLAMDDLVVTGASRRERYAVRRHDRDRIPDELAEAAAAGMARIGASVRDLYDGPVSLGLSGGKDSRVIAASLLAGGTVPAFSTNTTSPEEGTTAVELLDRLHAATGVRAEHRLYEAGDPEVVLAQPLLVRAENLRLRYDHEFGSSYLARRAVAPAPSRILPAPGFSGAGGEAMTAYWHPGQPLAGEGALQEQVAARMCGVVTLDFVAPAARELHVQRARAAVRSAREVGLEGFDVLDHAYLSQRMRRWSSLGQSTGQVAPFLAPELVEAAFAMTPAQKAARALHLGVLSVLAPHWEGVPFVTGATGGRRTVVWDGDGLATLEGIMAGPPGTLTELLDRPGLEGALASAWTGKARTGQRKALEELVMLAVADAGFGTGPSLQALRESAGRAATAARVQPVGALVEPSAGVVLPPWLRNTLRAVVPAPARVALRTTAGRTYRGVARLRTRSVRGRAAGASRRGP